MPEKMLEQKPRINADEVCKWSVYIVRCADNTYYTGIATDIERRLTEHNGDNGAGAKYTRARQPVELVYKEHAGSRAAALRREIQIKKLSRQQKEHLISGM